MEHVWAARKQQAQALRDKKQSCREMGLARGFLLPEAERSRSVRPKRSRVYGNVSDDSRVYGNISDDGDSDKENAGAPQCEPLREFDNEHELYSKDGEEYHRLVRVMNQNDFDPFTHYVHYNVALLQHHFYLAIRHGRSCVDAELVLSPQPLSENSVAGTMYHELKAECLACGACFILPNDGFPSKRTNNANKAYSQLSLRTGIAMVGLDSDFHHLDTMAAGRGDLCRFGRRPYFIMMHKIAKQVDEAVTAKIKQNRQTSKAKIRELAAAGDEESEVLPQGLAGMSNRIPTHTR